MPTLIMVNHAQPGTSSNIYGQQLKSATCQHAHTYAATAMTLAESGDVWKAANDL